MGMGARRHGSSADAAFGGERGFKEENGAGRKGLRSGGG